MKEFNNREEAKKNAEYITGSELRKYLANKVKKYVEIDNPTVFDGAIGSGQLQQFLNPSKVYGVEIQEKAYLTVLENYENADIENKSFFDYLRDDFVCDVVVMNPPFSLPFKNCSEEEKENIRKEFPWKKSGKLDEIFVLKSLKYTKRYAFYILFPGMSYRREEQHFRDLIGNALVELNLIEEAFEDTSIPVIFLVIDKEKTTNEVHKEIYNCKKKQILKEEKGKIVKGEKWEQAKIEIEREEVNIDEISASCQEHLIDFVEKRISLDVFLVKELNANINVLDTIKKVKEICNKYEKIMKEEKKECKRSRENIGNKFIQMSLFGAY